MRRLLAAAGLWLGLQSSAAGAPRVASLDSCADQYVLALSPREAIVGLSPRAEDGDSYLRARASGLPKRRATLESLLAVRPQVVVRAWGGDAVLVRRLQAHGATVVTLGEARDFEGVRADVRRAAKALGNVEGGEALIAGMDRKLKAARGGGGGRRALYLTPGGATAGPGVMVDAMLSAAGLRNAETRPGYRLLSLERLALAPPEALVLGFFDAFALGRSWWSPARSSVIRGAASQRTLARLPGSELACPAWFAADGVLAMARGAP